MCCRGQGIASSVGGFFDAANDATLGAVDGALDNMGALVKAAAGRLDAGTPDQKGGVEDEAATESGEYELVSPDDVETAIGGPDSQAS